MKDDHLTAPATALLQQIIRCVRRYHLFRRGEHVLLCVSGGADSMALLTALHELAPKIGIRLSVCHLNHRLRGHDADEDERFVRRAAARLGIKCVVARPDVSRLARERGQSLAMAGRDAGTARDAIDHEGQENRMDECGVEENRAHASDQDHELHVGYRGKPDEWQDAAAGHEPGWR